jgi:predicted DNA-binding protein with PD1-like motif
MKVISIRLKKGADLKEEIELCCNKNNILAGVVLSSVGCVSIGKFRVSDGKTIKTLEEGLEILSLNGTVSKYGIHLHVSYGNKDGISYGGHLVEGNIINTTCELVIGVLEDTTFKREEDNETGYKELVIYKKI